MTAPATPADQGGALTINLPHQWEPRPYQEPMWAALQSGIKRAVGVWHRRAGKDLTFMHWTATQAFERVGLYWHILPTYQQGRKIVWEGMTRDGTPFLSAFPDETIVSRRNDEMTLYLEGGSQWQVIGTDNVDRLVGTNPVGCVFSEYSLQNPKAWDFIRPILAENGGWAAFIYTPRGRNHGYRMYEMAKNNEKWFCELLTRDDTLAISEEAIQDERDAGMAEELIQQEFYCSFDAPLVGSYYGDLITKAMKDGRIVENVPWDPNRPVFTAWDIGKRDGTSIIFAQLDPAGPIRIIEDYFVIGKEVPHFAKLLKERPYVYADHMVPHDIKQEHVTGKSALEQFRALGIRMRVIPDIGVNDGIQAVRSILPRCWFSELKAGYLIDALREYSKEQMEGLYGPDGQPVFRDKPKHDWASHPADAMRILAVGMKKQYGEKRERRKSKWKCPA